MSECICKGNLQAIVKETSPYFDRWYKDEKGRKYTFVGVLIASDDYYYIMSSHDNGRPMYLSCVGNIENHGFELVETE